MPDLMIPLFGHHLIPLLSLPGAVGPLGGKAHLAAVKDTCKSAERIHGALTMAGRYEVAVVSDDIDFFDPSPGLAKARNVAWETIRMTQRLQWVVPTRNPENISPSLPLTWIGKGFQNVCLGLVADSADVLSEKLEALRKAPVQRRMILLSPCNPAIDLSGQLGEIDWVVLSGNSENSSWAAMIKAACREANVAFLFHQPDGVMDSGPTNEGADDAPPWPVHPFGTKIELFQPTLPNLKPVITSTEGSFSPPALVENDPEPTSPAAMKIIDYPVTDSPESPTAPTELTTKIVKFEIVSPEAALEPAPALSTISEDAHQEFVQLDGVVRRGLGTFKEVGHALAAIRDRDLWRAGGHTSWAAYCLAVGDLSKSHANRLIKTSEIASRLAQVTPIGATLLTESQVRPLCRLKTQDLQITALSRAVERASNGQPTTRLLSDVVAELMADASPPKASKPSHKQLVAAAIQRLRASVAAEAPVEQTDGLITDLAKLLKIA